MIMFQTPYRLGLVSLLCIIFCLIGWSALASSDYDYPINNPLAATVIGTPAKYKAKFDADIPIKRDSLSPLVGKEIPSGFWYNEDLQFSYALQSRAKAPLIFIIAGTGARHNSQKMLVLLRKFYSEGFHVINVSSPTHPNFVVSRSKFSMPGNLWIDANDIYSVFEEIVDELDISHRVSEYYLTGYSLGGAHSAFVSFLDQQRKRFNFKKTLLINPPLSLYSSVQILDAMWDRSEYYEGGDAVKLADKIFEEASKIFSEDDFTQFNEDFLYSMYKDRNPSDSDLASLIGLSFRLSSSGMVFSSDVLRKENFVYPSNEEFTVTTSTIPYMQKLSKVSFQDYVKRMFYPFYSQFADTLSFDQLISASNLTYLSSYIVNNPSFALVTNADDIILAPGELETLKQLFSGRYTVFPNGGHCGNIEHKVFLQSLLLAIGYAAPVENAEVRND